MINDNDNKVYVDDSVFLALILGGSYGILARNGLAKITKRNQYSLVTSDFVLIEVARFLISKSNYSDSEAKKVISLISEKSEIEDFRFEIISAQTISKNKNDTSADLADQRVDVNDFSWEESLHWTIMTDNNVKKIISMRERIEFPYVSGVRVFTIPETSFHLQ